MLNNNLFIDEKNLTKIPQNDKIFFDIRKSKEYTKSIEIKIDWTTDINFLNFYLILKSFCHNLIYIPKNVLITIKNTEEQSFITFNKEIHFFKKIRYNRFIEWFVEQLAQDKIYLKPEGLYSFTIVLITSREIDNLKPIYPWKNEILNSFWKNIDYEISFEEIIEQKNKIIEENKKNIEKLKEKIKELEIKKNH